jgi:coenzyme F420-reducing hydrogenase gamma subunit
MVRKIKRPRIAFFGHTSCKGCFFEFLILENKILELLKVADIVHFELLKEYNEEGPFDITFMDGAVSTVEEVDILSKIREDSKFLIAFGTCACWGGIPSIKNYVEDLSVAYPKPQTQKTIDALPIDQYVKVDYYLRGCPISKEECLEVIKDLLVGKTPREKDYCVCVECKLRETRCLFEDGKVCLGPVTYAGCGAPCPTIRASCDGCRGPLPDGNIGQEIKLLTEHGISNDDIKRMFSKYAGPAEKFKEVKINDSSHVRNKKPNKGRSTR